MRTFRVSGRVVVRLGNRKEYTVRPEIVGEFNNQYDAKSQYMVEHPTAKGIEVEAL